MRDICYQIDGYAPPTLTHHYGQQVHLLADPLLWHELAVLCRASTEQPALTALVRSLYLSLVRHAVAASWPRRNRSVTTRMVSAGARGVWQGVMPIDDEPTVVVDIARAGTVPAQTAFELLCGLFDAQTLRQDHLFMARITNDAGEVTGIRMDASKVAGTAAGCTVLLPDPMGATGGTMAAACTLYKNHPGGAPKRLIALHLIVTPEYLAKMTSLHPDVEIWAIRLDRGMSKHDILATTPGLHQSQERGLDERHYIVPGAGDLGDLLNNTDA